MKSALLCFGLMAFLSAISAKSDYFSGFSADEYEQLQKITRYLQKRVREAEAAEEISQRGAGIEIPSRSSENEMNPAFVYSVPETEAAKAGDATSFAVGPSDPRFYRNFADLEKSPDFEVSQWSRDRGSKTSKPSDYGFRDEVPAEGDDGRPSHSAAVHQIPVADIRDEQERADIYFTGIVAGCSAAAAVAVVAIGIGCYRLQKNAKAAADVDYPAYGVTGPNKDISPTSGDRRLAQSAQMYHYQHQKQQIIAMESMTNKERRGSISDAESEEENEEGDYTVYECPGLAPTGEMEVKNPLFQDDQTPASNEKATTDVLTEESRELPNLIWFD